MMKLDIQGLVRGICGLPEQEEDEGALFGEGYLVQCVALPFLCGEDISLHEIDWDAFDPEDARAMYYRCEQAEQLHAPVLQLYRPALAARPVPAAQVRFV